MKRILVTGVKGFAGNYIASFLTKEGHKVYGLARHATTEDDMPFPILCHDLAFPLSLDMDCDVIVHTAGAHPGCSVVQLKRDNIDAMQNIIDFAHKHNVSRIIFLSSVSVYGTIFVNAVNEDTSITDPDAYGLSKRLAELLLLDQSQIEGICLRLPGLFGINANHSWLVDTTQRICKGKDVTIYSPEFLSNNFVYIKDLAKFIQVLLEKQVVPPVCLLGAEEKISIFNLVQSIKEKANSPAKIHFGKSLKPSFSLDVQKALSCGYKPMAPLEMISDFFADRNSNGMEANR